VAKLVKAVTDVPAIGSLIYYCNDCCETRYDGTWGRQECVDTCGNYDWFVTTAHDHTYGTAHFLTGPSEAFRTFGPVSNIGMHVPTADELEKLASPEVKTAYARYKLLHG
jgi:hypothetical protein